MKTPILSLIILFLFNCNSETKKIDNGNDEKGKYSITVNGSCNYNGELTATKFYAFNSDIQSQKALSKIMEYTGLPVNFKLMASDVDNACAVIQLEKSGDALRYILYNQQFMMEVKDATKNHWAEISILAHEIGHHLSGHTLTQGGSRPDIELEADRFSGFILYKMGASLEDAQIAMKTFSPEITSSTHPGKKSRLIAITNGWLAAKEQDHSKQNETETSETTMETISSSTKNHIINILNRYYQINEASECNQLSDFYLPVVETYYNKSNQTSSQVINECNAYHARWLYQQMNIDNSTFVVTQLNNGDYFVTYDMFFQVKKNIQDPWKDFNLTINVRFTPDFKIRSIYEYQKPNK